MLCLYAKCREVDISLHVDITFNVVYMKVIVLLVVKKYFSVAVVESVVELLVLMTGNSDSWQERLSPSRAQRAVQSA